MDSLDWSQADIRKKTDWSKATASQLYNGSQDYSPKVVNEAAAAFQCHPWELLMPYEQAMAFRRLRVDALRIVEGTREIPTSDEPESIARRG